MDIVICGFVKELIVDEFIGEVIIYFRFYFICWLLNFICISVVVLELEWIIVCLVLGFVLVGVYDVCLFSEGYGRFFCLKICILGDNVVMFCVIIYFEWILYVDVDIYIYVCLIDFVWNSLSNKLRRKF